MATKLGWTLINKRTNALIRDKHWTVLAKYSYFFLTRSIAQKFLEAGGSTEEKIVRARLTWAEKP